MGREAPVKKIRTPAAKRRGSRGARSPESRTRRNSARPKAEVTRREKDQTPPESRTRRNSARPKAVVSRRDKDQTHPDITTVPAYIAALTRWQRKVAEEFDRIVQREVPKVRRAIKWSLPFYGVSGRGWFASLGGFPKGVKITFFQGASLKPPPPAGRGRQLRGLDVHRGDELDGRLIASWVRQAARLPGFGSS
jgi:hypothetical protein